MKNANRATEITMVDDVPMNKTFENIVSKKYRLQIEDMGGLLFSSHWVDELSYPINMSQFQISQDMGRLASTFPIDLIPFKTETEMKIDKLDRKIKKLNIRKGNL